jgi:hypothetical protein
MPSDGISAKDMLARSSCSARTEPSLATSMATNDVLCKVPLNSACVALTWCFRASPFAVSECDARNDGAEEAKYRQSCTRTDQHTRRPGDLSR